MNTFASKMDAFLDEYCRLYKFSGTLRVTHKGETIYKRHMGFADVEHNIPIDDKSVFTIYSMSKPLCALGFMKLWDKGLVSLDDHPGKYIPEAAGLHPDLTYYHMLHHISSLPDFDDFPEMEFKYSRQKPFNLRGMVKEMAQTCEIKAPGQWRYANINFGIPALTIENVTGMPYGEFLKKEIFEPIGMYNTCIDHNGLLIPNKVRGYDIKGHDLESVNIDFDYFLGSGDAASTVEDIYALSREMMEHKVLSDAAWEHILTPNPGGDFGKGCTVTDWHGKTRVTHNGGHNGFRTLHVLLPEDDFDIILLSNSGYGNSRYTLAEAVYTAFYGADGADAGKMANMDAGFIRAQEQSGFDYEGFLPKIPDRVPLTPEQEAKVLGDHGYFFMEKDGDDYCLVMNYYRRLPCRHVGEGKFVSTVIDETYGVNIE